MVTRVCVLKLTDSGQNKGKIDLLIVADFYWSVIDGAVKRVDDMGYCVDL